MLAYENLFAKLSDSFRQQVFSAPSNKFCKQILRIREPYFRVTEGSL